MGVSFALDGDDRDVEWCGLGPGAGYPDTGQAATPGWWRSTIDGLQEHTVRPQEAGARAGVRWASLGFSAGGQALEVAPSSGAGLVDVPAITVRPWSADELLGAAHDDELRGDGRTHVIVDLVRAGVGTARCGPGVLPAYRLPARDVSGGIRFFVCSPQEDS